jgi:regulatory protein
MGAPHAERMARKNAAPGMILRRFAPQDEMIMSDAERCYAAAMRILGHRFNSEAELRLKLRAKKFEREIIDDTINRLRTEKWLDDERFAGAYVRTRQKRKIGPRRIARELSAAGVDQETARHVIAENTDEERELSDLTALCEKRKRLLSRRYGRQYLETAEGRKKLAGYLFSHGYDAALIQRVIKEIPVADD